MSLENQATQINTRYKLAPNITLGKLKGSLIGLKAQSLTKVDGEGLIEFIDSVIVYLVKENGVSIQELTEVFQADEDQLVNVFEFLVANGLCVKTSSEFNSTALLAYERAGGQVSLEEIVHNIETTFIEIIADDNNVIATKLSESLREFGIRVLSKDDRIGKPSIRVVVGKSHLDPLLEKANELALEDHTPWLSIVPYDSQTAWVGPFFIPHQSACLHCYNLRKSANFADEVFRSDLMKIKPIIPETLPVYNQPVNTVQIGIASNLLTEWITLRDFGPATVPGGFTTINLDDRGISFNSHRVYRVPRCPKCSPAADTGFPQVWYQGEVNS